MHDYIVAKLLSMMSFLEQALTWNDDVDPDRRARHVMGLERPVLQDTLEHLFDESYKRRDDDSTF